ncbi:MAG TPA: hypothetical protein PLL10_11285 [Elusimicrobiales bacterium]|nr:hypothetical protein [Elusimicrobiales bacterium]
MNMFRRVCGLLLLIFSLSGLAYIAWGVRLKLAPQKPAAPPPEPQRPRIEAMLPLDDSWQTQTLRNLEELRRALDSYKAENGSFPDKLDALAPKYIAAIPEIKTAENEKPSGAVRYGAGQTLITNAGGWAYVNDAADPHFGALAVNSVARDREGRLWFAL